VVLLNPLTLAEFSMRQEIWLEILSFHDDIASDDYVRSLSSFYKTCILRYGASWRYLDIVNFLYAASKLLQPRNYLEIGVRRGRSACVVSKACPSVDIIALDIWQPNYAGMDNPGPEFVREELGRCGHRGKLSFINANSHQALPALFANYPELSFDLITVDGDHTADGAIQDLEDVIPHLSVGGVLIFDDIIHPAHRYLLDCWKQVTAKHPQLRTYEFTDAGFGVAAAVRHA
jgi:predicted O-methyltransferase YrrM